MSADTLTDEDEPWGIDPADRWVMVRADLCSTGLWHVDGMGDVADALPPIPRSLVMRIEAFAHRYDQLDSANDDRFPDPTYWEQRADFPVAAFNEEGRAIARALKAALPPDWTVVHEDVDAWLAPRGVPRETRQLILPGIPPPEPSA